MKDCTENRRVFESVMNGTDDQAEEFLKRFGGVAKLSTYGCPIEEVVRLYGVSASYARGVLSRNGMSSKKFPADIKLASKWEFEHEYSFPPRWFSSMPIKGKDDVLRVSYKDPCTYYEIPYGAENRGFSLAGKTAFYSPKMVLAFAAIAMCGRTIPEESMVQKVYNELLMSDYNKVSEPEPEPAPEAPAISEILNPDMNVLMTGGDAKVTMSVDALASLLRAVIGETVNAVWQKSMEANHNALA